MVRSLWITLCLVFSLPVVGSENLLTERYNLSYLDLSNGLPHNNVRDIFKDSNGFLWISTFGGGLVRYDGYSFMAPRLDLNSKSCRSITEDDFHRLWVAFDEGINIIDLRTMNSVVPDHPELQKLLVQPSIRCYRDALGRIWIINDQQISLVTFKSEGEINHICAYPHPWRMLDMAISDVEGNGKPWIGIDGGLYRLVEKDGKLVREGISALLNPLEDHYITDILKRNNVVWITTNMGLFRYDPYRQKLDEYHHSSVPGSLSHVFLSSLAVTPDNHLLVGSLFGVNIYDDQTDSFTAWTTESNPPLKSDFVHSIRVFHGHIWICTESGGIACLAPRRLMLRNSVHTGDSRSLSPNPVNAMYIDSDSRLWVGTVEGGLNLREKGSHDFIHYTTSNSGLSHNSVSALAADQHGRLWIGTWGGGVCVTDRKNPQKISRLELSGEYLIRTTFVGALANDTINDGLWIGSNAGLFYYDFKTQKIEEPFEGCRNVTGSIGAIVDRDGFLWMGCMQGLRIVDLNSGRQGRRPFKTEGITHKLDEPGSRIVDKISSFCQTKDGTLWLGSNGYGLYRLVKDGKDGHRRFEALTTEDGLAFSGVKGVVEDLNGHLWVTTQNGLSVYDPKTHIFSNYFENEGLINHHFYWNSAARDDVGVIYLGSEGGLIEVLGENTESKSYGKLVFTHLMVDNQEVTAGSDYLSEDISIASSIQLREGNRSFSISFSALDYGNEEQAMFSYRMKGLEKEWMPLMLGEHSVRYSALPAGRYTFEVKYMSTLSAEHSETASIEVVVSPYFWNSWWFRLLLSVLFVGLIIYIYNRRVAELKRREAEQLLNPIRKVLQESENPGQLQSRIQNILDNQERYKKSVSKSVEADKEEVLQSSRPFMERVMEIMEQHYTNSQFGVQEFCDAIGMSRSVASKHLNAEVGVPVGQFIRNYRLNMAKELLSAKTGNRNITEIAYKVGFNDPKYFTRCFTKMFGVSPSSYTGV
jgi:ligand-binding sensor domain-containing protein/AraC-like DNA-binding protein